ncbi:MAG TPA: LysR substrate-binding domain-containing protein [Burkholderiaceae bacterium]|nr:LysR substrate-binding domain-containing protein [Burkholderiaceae bacterium]
MGVLFVATAESLSLTRGSARQHLSLAAASSRVKALETRSGTALLERGARGVRLTPAGEAFLHHARALLRQTEQLRAELREYSGGLRGHVRVFANTTAVTDFLPDILPTYLAAHPKINIDLQEKPNGEIARGVRESRADIGIVAGQVDTTGLTATHFNTDRLVLVVPRGHALARRKAVAFAETLEEDHVGMHASSTLHAYLTDIAQRLDRPLKLRIQLANFDALCRMVGAGVGVGVVPETTARRNLAAMAIRQVELTDAWRWRERFVLVREGEVQPEYARALIDVVCAHYDTKSNEPDASHARRA